VHELRAEFPVLERVAYLNAGTNGPVPARAVDAARAALAKQLSEGRGGQAFFQPLQEDQQRLRLRAVALLGCDAGEVALTRSTTDGVNTVLGALELGRGDEVLTSDEEHPGLLAPLAALRERRGIELRVVPFDELASEVGPRTRLIACSHVSWVTGRMVDAQALAAADAPVLLDGAQGLGAVPVDVLALGCDFYAASGQKWLCGPNGLGYLYVRRARIGDLLPPWPGYGALAEASRPLELPLHEDARRFDGGVVAPHHSAWALASLDVLTAPGLPRVHARAAQLAARLASALAERGVKVAPRGESTLVSWESPDPEADTLRLRERDIVVRHLPGWPYVRASVGAWTSEDELDRLVATWSS
jgi:L-cysteine/cystine lyase